MTKGPDVPSIPPAAPGYTSEGPGGHTEIVHLQWAEIRRGKAEIVSVTFGDLPPVVKTALFPEWDHPPGCECHPCWLRKECRNS